MRALAPKDSETEECSPASTVESTILYQHPGSWKTDNRTRRFIALSKRRHSRETDLGILRRSVDLLLRQQDSRGSFYTEDEYRLGDKVDDQLAAAAMLAFLLSETGPDQQVCGAMERAVRFHLDRLIWKSPGQPYRYSRYLIDRDSSGDWSNTLWCLWGAALVLRHGSSYLADGTADTLRKVMAEYWSFLSTSATRDENPCHNQLLAYCHIGILHAQATGHQAVLDEVSEYYHRRLRRLRVRSCGHWIYGEFNQWDPHYGMVSWLALESLFAATGDPAYGEDADEMALYFNERVSAGGYLWGGSRLNEGGIEEFVHLPTNRVVELGLDRLLLPAPSHLWRHLAMDAHLGRTLITRMEVPLQGRTIARPLTATPWHFQKGGASASLRDDVKLHHVSAGGLEIIPGANAWGVGSGLIWLNGGGWKSDILQLHAPEASEGHRYSGSVALDIPGEAGLATMQRGYFWETRQWWISHGEGILWIGHLVAHAFLSCDRISFILGNPVLTRLSGEAVPVTEVTTHEGVTAETQGDPVIVSSARSLRFGDVHLGATAPLEFVRPGRDAFHTFPAPGGRLWRDLGASNELRLRLLDAPGLLDCRESVFFAVEIGRKPPVLKAHREHGLWRVNAGNAAFEAREHDGVWNYRFENDSGRAELPPIHFRFSEA